MNNKMEIDKDGAFKIKVILIGNAGVGKTSLINRAMEKGFTNKYHPTNNGCFSVKQIVINNQKYNLYLWDTIGQEKLKSLTKIFFKNSQIVIFVYDITKRTTFKGLQFWLKEVNDNLPEETVKGICGNKSDLFTQEEVTRKELEEYAGRLNAQMTYTSAKEDIASFNELLTALVKEYLGTNDEQKSKKKEQKEKNITLELSPNKEEEEENKEIKKKKKCC
jgi:small GTP-binding protein